MGKSPPGVRIPTFPWLEWPTAVGIGGARKGEVAIGTRTGDFALRDRLVGVSIREVAKWNVFCG